MMQERELGGSTNNRICTLRPDCKENIHTSVDNGRLFIPSVGNLVYLTDWLAVQQHGVAVCG